MLKVKQTRPEPRVFELTTVKPEDAEFFNSHGFEVSTEYNLQWSRNFLYSTTGLISSNDGEPIVAIYPIDESESIEESVTALREKVEYMLANRAEMEKYL